MQKYCCRVFKITSRKFHLKKLKPYKTMTTFDFLNNKEITKVPAFSRPKTFDDPADYIGSSVKS